MSHPQPTPFCEPGALEGRYEKKSSTRIVLSASARPNSGGQGLNLTQMVEALRSQFELLAFCRTGYPGVPGGAIAESEWVRLMDQIPMVRGVYDFRNQLSNSHFDRMVAARLPACDVFQGVTGQCLTTIERARRAGAFTIVDCITAHIDHFYDQQQRECQVFGIRPDFNRAARDMALAEYQAADSIRVMSEFSKRTLVERGIDDPRVFIARPPCSVEDFPIAHFSGPRFRVSFVGLLVPAKGFHYLIEAFKRLSGEDMELILWAAPGHRAIARYMDRQMALDRRIRMQSVSVRQNYGKVYGDSHVVVHPSLSDGYAYVVVEAMASGLPVIVTSATGAAEFIRDGVNGYVVPPRDSEAIHERLLYLARNPGLVYQMGAAARETIRGETAEALRNVYAAKILAVTSGRAA